jgi:anti-sigma B factor antagonist
MADPRYPFVMIGGVPVVNAPLNIDAANAGWLQNMLLRAASCRRATVVVNMTGTRFCDSAGVGALVRAHEQALTKGGELVLVIPASAVLRVFALTGIARVIPHFADLNEALERARAVVPRPLPHGMPDRPADAGAGITPAGSPRPSSAPPDDQPPRVPAPRPASKIMSMRAQMAESGDSRAGQGVIAGGL